MARTVTFAQTQLATAWDAVLVNLRRMSSSVDIKPNSSSAVFVHNGDAPADVIRFDVNPVIIVLPVRANNLRQKIYVAVKGFLSFETAGVGNDPLRTNSFGTKIGYFRDKNQAAEHVYGAHYDIHENAPGHPVFHAHIEQQMELLGAVDQHFRTGWTATNTNDLVRTVLNRVRTPTAQMDLFSVIVQLCADHLIHEGSGQEVLDAFSNLLAASNFFVGAAHRMAFLNANGAPGCYRSTHWYAG